MVPRPPGSSPVPPVTLVLALQSVADMKTGNGPGTRLLKFYYSVEISLTTVVFVSFRNAISSFQHVLNCLFKSGFSVAVESL